MRITAIETIHFRRGVTVHAGAIQYLNGDIPLPPGPGLGVDLCEDVFRRPDVSVEKVS